MYMQEERGKREEKRKGKWKNAKARKTKRKEQANAFKGCNF